ncbi:hypothetical protein GN956_G20399 [Arapaima gigas]
MVQVLNRELELLELQELLSSAVVKVLLSGGAGWGVQIPAESVVSSTSSCRLRSTFAPTENQTKDLLIRSRAPYLLHRSAAHTHRMLKHLSCTFYAGASQTYRLN